MLHYHLTPLPVPHLFRVALTMTVNESHLVLTLPNWTSGSYLIRDYAGRVRDLCVSQGTLTQLDKNRWAITDLTPDSLLTVIWHVFAYSMGIHDAWLDEDRGFINPSALFIAPETSSSTPIQIEFDAPNYDIYTTLTNTKPHHFVASNYDELLDAPFTLIKTDVPATLIEVACQGIPHQMIISGQSVTLLNIERIKKDLLSILDTTIAFWGEAPFTHYLFHLHLDPQLYGGLEHDASCVLQFDAASLPGLHEDRAPAAYDDFLTLVAHEYFHAWLVKYLRPKAFLPYALNRESHSHDLWIFEGFTSYYENVIPYRAGTITQDRFLSLLSQRFNRVREREGFHHESLASASFNAWTHLYKQTEDSPYAQTSYYGKGAQLAFMLDVALRHNTNDACSLESVLRNWFEKARANETHRGLIDGAFFKTLIPQPLIERFTTLVETTDSTLWQQTWDETLTLLGLTEKAPEKTPLCQSLLGLFLDTSRQPITVRYAHSEGVAYQAGLFAKDQLIAFNGYQLRAADLDRVLSQARGTTADIHFFREKQLRAIRLAIPVSSTPGCGTLTVSTLTPLGHHWLKSAN